MVEELNAEDVKKKAIKILNNTKFWVIGFLVIAVILGVYIRSLPMQDHGGTPGLWDITTNNWTLGPDLDPWLFLRTSKSVLANDSVPRIDMMRNVPLGYDTSTETLVLPYLIVCTYKISQIFYSGTNIEFAGAIFPVIMFAFTILGFFLLVREIFIRKSKKSKIRANLISLVSTFLMIVMPVFLSRTIAGIPEKESAGFLFMFLSLYFFLKSWKVKNKISYVWAGLAGISTALLGLIWGGVMFVYIIIALAFLIAFILEKTNKRKNISYGIWIISSIIITSAFSGKHDLLMMATSISSGFGFFNLVLFGFDYLFWNTKIKEKIPKSKIPRKVISIIFTFGIILILALLFLGPSYLIAKIKTVHQTIFNPITGRWNTTVAENQQPYFTEWVTNFGPYLKNIPLMFWLFFTGLIFLFLEAVKKINKKQRIILTLLFVLVLSGIIFSRYSSSSIFNGDNFISKSFYYLSLIIFAGYALKLYFEDREIFKKIRFEYIFVFSIMVIGILSARSAVRLVMVLGPISTISIGYLNILFIEKWIKTKDKNKKLIWMVLMGLVVLLTLFSFYQYYKEIKVQAYNFVPSAYNQQWQKAMKWVREETPADSVFAHWWDYGYWVQSIGERATVLDGGNAIAYWNYLMGRYVLTGENQKDALDFLYSHDADYLLIDSTDISKYGAFSSIGSDENYDRLSWVGSLILDDRYTQETQDTVNYLYNGGVALDEDVIIEKDGVKVLLPAQKAGVGGILVPFSPDKSVIKQPSIIFVYQGQQYVEKLRYIYINGDLIDFQTGINAVGFVIPRVSDAGGGLTLNQIGAMAYISPRLIRGFLSQEYLLNGVLENFPNFELAYSEDSLVVESLRQQGLNVPEFVYYGGIQGPIKIWKINYRGDEILKEEYTSTVASDYISWKL